MQKRDVCISIDGKIPTRNMRKSMSLPCVINVMALIRFHGIVLEENRKQTNAATVAKHAKLIIDLVFFRLLSVSAEMAKGAEIRKAQERLSPSDDSQFRAPIHDPIAPNTPNPTLKAVRIRMMRINIGM